LRVEGNVGAVCDAAQGRVDRISVHGAIEPKSNDGLVRESGVVSSSHNPRIAGRLRECDDAIRHFHFIFANGRDQVTLRSLHMTSASLRDFAVANDRLVFDDFG